MIMEFVPGGSLRGYLDKKRANITADLMSRSKTIFVDIGQQIAEGMKYLVSSVGSWLAVVIDTSCYHPYFSRLGT